MLNQIVTFSVRNKLIVLILTIITAVFGIYALTKISIGAVPDITNNQVQIITTSQNLSTEDIELFITYPIELEMGNLPGVEEIRSISKFGLSVVTIVFDDEMGTYLPRQLISEKIAAAAKNIPKKFGEPEMGPITTGLGEIYQYILDVDPAYKDFYSPRELRTIQDWVVKRQLTGIPGVVEVNTWGGYLKQYEVAINTKKLNAMDISIHEVFKALENNNSNSGGAYIEKDNYSYFIRGEGLIETLEDIKNTVVVNRNGIPVYIRDIGEVGFGDANRFGAITGNGEGEKVLGQVMMLKNANSKQVIENVKTRMEEISTSLPEGVYINAFLDRSELIEKTTFTITENLILGCLIVIFVVVLILGNLRSGLIIASIIPLSLLFAISLMYLFGIDANLMSLGAIDFGIIIDGAVIIVEYLSFQIIAHQRNGSSKSIKGLATSKDEVVIHGTSKLMNSAVFGQLIILIVFIPVLSLSGVEGKLFRPMALTFSFALIGAMILCFTYVPVLSSLVLKGGRAKSLNLSDRLIHRLKTVYGKSINLALQYKRTVIATALTVFVFSIYVFNQLGAEFIPTLDEGDFVIQPVLETGTSLSKTIEISTQIETILLNEFSEVDQVVTRIGAAEVPTDPMSMEETDVIIILKDKSEWTTAGTKDELAEKFKKALMVIPGMEVEFTQPIEMRFNELITGVRADIAIKVFGEDLETLSSLGFEISNLIAEVPGAADITVEKIVGLPEMRVTLDRKKISRFGLNIQDINDVIAAGFGGKTTGSVFEGERRFDLVVRLKDDNRQSLDDLKRLYIDLPEGGKVPMSELAKVSYETGAAKISRDDTRRRIVVSVNVRNRDLQSIVGDIQEILNKELILPVGYSISYGGQFENLESAKARLFIAVPLSLSLIFFMLFLAFRSIKEVLIIYTAIPLSAVGGILLLWIRDMPFSISAGIGFIALFGIAVLNGIVLIEHLKTLDIRNFESMNQLIKEGTKDRLRAVLLTATAAAMGFLPMAFSGSAGAEVQRPLATVVIGGLVSATFLTLVVLPVLYSVFIANKNRRIKSNSTSLFILIALFFLPSALSGQERPEKIGLDSLIPLAFENNLQLKADQLKLLKNESLKNSAQFLDKTEIYYQYDENNLAINNEPIGVFGIQQDFRFPTLFFAEKRLKSSAYELSQSSYDIQRKKTEKETIRAYYNYQIAIEKRSLLKELDSVFFSFSKIAERRFELGETNYLEKITAASKQTQIRLKYEEANTEVHNAYLDLKKVVQFSDTIRLKDELIIKVPLKDIAIENTPEINYYSNRVHMFKNQERFERNKRLPDLSFEYFQGSNSNLDFNLIGYQFGIKIPLLLSGQSSKIKAASIESDIAQIQLDEYNLLLLKKLEVLQNRLKQIQKSMFYYEREGKDLSVEILNTSRASYDNGEINFYQYIQSLESAFEIEINYLSKVKEYNSVIIEINYLTL